MSAASNPSLAVSRAVGLIFRSARELQRLTQQQVASMTEASLWPVSRTAISDIECGHCLPGVEATISLSKVLHVDPTEILERVDLATKVPIDLTGVSFEELKQRARQSFHSGDFRAALGLYDAMIERLALESPSGPSSLGDLEARVEVSRSVALRRCNALRAAQASAQRALELADGFPDASARA